MKRLLILAAAIAITAAATAWARRCPERWEDRFDAYRRIHGLDKRKP
jgi:hypothetical protein